MFFDDTILFDSAPIFIIIIAVIVFGSIIFLGVSKLKENVDNNKAPQLTVPAEVISKRTDVQGNHSYTTYYATFEVQSGDRMELKLNGKEFGMLADKDIGMLTFQGTRYIAFERQ